MQQPNLRTSRLRISGGLLAAGLLIGAGFFLGRASAPEDTGSVTQPSETVARPQLDKLAVPHVLGRRDLVSLSARAADALTLGAEFPESVANSIGRRFELVLPFGCNGPSSEESALPLRWSYSPDEQTLRIHVGTIQWNETDWNLRRSEESDTQVHLEGFWMERPWSSADRCPQNRSTMSIADGRPLIVSSQTLALAETVPENRRLAARPYVAVLRVPPEKLAADDGFRLRLKGRVARLADGPPVKCVQPAGIEQRPICLLGVTFGEIRIENPVSGETLATWAMRATSSRQTP